jgi:hypothetical protein
MESPADSSFATVAYGQDFRPAQVKQVRLLEAEGVQTYSFLETVSKEFDAVVARRLSYLAETCRLLAENQFGG